MFLQESSFVPRLVLENLSGTAKLESWLRFEGELASAQGELGLIPEEAARVISGSATLARVPLERVLDYANEMGLATAGMVRALSEACGHPYGEYVHWGATTTDVTETGLALQLSPVLGYLLESTSELLRKLAELAHAHRRTLVVARTHTQHALPITFGYKVSLWGREILWARERLSESQGRFLVCKLTGAAGNHAAFGPKGQLVQERLSHRLGLRVADPSIQISRNRVIDLLTSLCILANGLYHMAHDIRTGQRPEIGEVEEQYRVGIQRGSSTLPAKRNPFTAELICGYVNLIRRNVAAELTLVSEDERDSVAATVESVTVSETLKWTAAALNAAHSLVEKLVVHPDRMRANLESTGTVMAEAIMMVLARSIGRQKAYDLVYRAANEARSSGRALREVIDEVIRGSLTGHAIEVPWDYRDYLGSVEDQIDSFIKHSIGSLRTRDG